MSTFAEINEKGNLINICDTRPEKRNTTHEIVQLKHMPDLELIHPEGLLESVPLKYDPDTQLAVLDEDAWDAAEEQERKDEIVSIVRRKKDIQDVQEAYGINYSTELATLEARLVELTT